MTLKELQETYAKKQLIWKTHIRLLPTKWKRFWAWVWFFIAFPFVWLFYNIRDWRTAIFIVISLLLWSSSVWIWYLLAICSGWTTNLAKWFAGIGTAVWIWWASPVGSPFILLVTFTAIGMKALFNKIVSRKHTRKMRKIEPLLNKPSENKKPKKEKINGKNAKKSQKCDL